MAVRKRAFILLYLRASLVPVLRGEAEGKGGFRVLWWGGTGVSTIDRSPL